MADIIKINDKNIVNILNNKGGLEIGKPFTQEIFLIEVHIAGTTHIDNMDILEPKLKEGVEVQFFREPNNQYDERAIVVKDKDGNKLGYIPRDKNEILSRLMDAGKLLYGKVKRKEKIGEWTKIEMEVYLKD